MVYGYARVSTKGQDKYGNSLTDQETRLREAGAVEIYHDSYTGTKMERPAFSKLMNLLKCGDTLIVTKLDRFARNASKGAEMMQDLVDRGVRVNILNMGIADNTPMGKLMVHIMFAFAEFERDMIVERTQTGKEVCRENKMGWREGRKRKEPEGLREMAARVEAGVVSVAEACAALNISRSTWARRLKEIA